MIDVAILQSNSTILQFLMEKNVIKKTNSCPQCNLQMDLVEYNCLDSYIWRCPDSYCSRRVSIRSESIFEKSHLKLKDILSILNFYGIGISPKNCSKMIKIRGTTVQEWYQCFRERMSSAFQILKQEKIGGFNQIVEIDECQIGRRKYHRGRAPNEIWLFGGINRNQKKEVFIEQVPDRKKNTLLAEIERNISDGTVIISDGWGAYKTINKDLAHHNFQHFTVNHKKKFVDTGDKNIHTQNIENLWRELRRFLKKYGRNVRKNLGDYINEFQIRWELKDDISDFILDSIKI